MCNVLPQNTPLFIHFEIKFKIQILNSNFKFEMQIHPKFKFKFQAGGNVSNLDDSFFAQLQQRQRDGYLTQETFHEMMASYMKTMESTRKKEKQIEKKKRREGIEQKVRE